MKDRYLLAEDTIDEQDLAELIEWLKTNPRLTQGVLVREFEDAWSRWLGVKHSLFVSSGSSANLLALSGLLESGRLKNKKIVVPAVSWATTVMPAMQLGFEPIMVDGEPETFGTDPVSLEEILKRHDPGSVILVHVLGVPAKMEALMDLKRRYGFALVEDACAAHGSRFDGKAVGTFGEANTFSFYFGHHISTIEGGMLSTDDAELADIFRMVRAHGWAKDLTPDKASALADRHAIAPFNRRFAFYHPGFNLRSTDLNARIGLSQMKKIDRVVARRNENDAVYRARLAGSPYLIQQNPRAFISSISIAVLAKDAAHRDRVAKALAAAKIETRPLGGGNMSRQPFWQKRYGAIELPFADRVGETAFHLPNHPSLSVEDVNFICDTVLAVS